MTPECETCVHFELIENSGVPTHRYCGLTRNYCGPERALPASDRRICGAEGLKHEERKDENLV